MTLDELRARLREGIRQPMSDDRGRRIHEALKKSLEEGGFIIPDNTNFVPYRSAIGPFVGIDPGHNLE